MPRKPKQEAMHEDHMAWRSEHDQWLDELHTWQAQQHKALADLSRVEVALYEHAVQLTEQVARIRAVERELNAHERELAALGKAGLGDQADPALAEHETWSRRQAEARAGQTALKERHLRLVALLKKVTSLAEA